jgi:hypothetical protein
MPNILHRISIDAPPERVHHLVATRAAAVFEVLERTPQRVVWRTVEGPADWIDTRITFAFHPRDDGGTTLLFRHEGWQRENEFMNGCSTNWAAYLTSLKSGAEGHGFNPFPGGEISRWS